MEMKVSMTLWLDGSRWPWPLVDSELWYNTRLLEDTAEAKEAAAAHHAHPDPSHPSLRPWGWGRWALVLLTPSRLWGHPGSGLLSILVEMSEKRW